LAAATAASLILPGAYRTRFFAEAADAATDISHSLPPSVWFQRFIHLLQSFALPFAYYFRPLCTAVALFW
jgi:hypothetical protein